MGDYAREHGSKLFIYYLKETDSGWYECSLPNGDSNRIHLTVRASNENTHNTEQETIGRHNYENDERNENEYSNSNQGHHTYHDQTERDETNERENDNKQAETYIEKNEDENVEIECPLRDSNHAKWRKLDGVILIYLNFK